MSKRIFICQEEQSNKVWSCETDGLTVRIEYGRIGGHMSTQTKTFSSPYSLNNFLDKKIQEKLGKGYKESTQESLKQETKTAQALGQQYKISKIRWLQKLSDNYQILKDYDPSEYVLVTILNSWSKEEENFLFNKKESFSISSIKEINGKYLELKTYTSYDKGFVSAVRQYVKDLYAHVHQVVTQKFAAIGVRSIDLGLDDDDTTSTPSSNIDTSLDAIVKEIGQSSASAQVISSFACMGSRVLDLD